MDDTLPITPPQIQTNRTVPSSRSSTAGSDNGEIPVTFTQNRLGNVTTQESYERGTFNNGIATPAFQDSYGNSRQVSESTSREDPWVSNWYQNALPSVFLRKASFGSVPLREAVVKVVPTSSPKCTCSWNSCYSTIGGCDVGIAFSLLQHWHSGCCLMLMSETHAAGTFYDRQG